MRQNTARPRADGTGWHYVSVGRHGGHPLGYCATHAPHSTEDEARECYRRWQRDHIRLHRDHVRWTSCRAEGCDQPARNAATIDGDGYALAPLCDTHLTIEAATTALHLTEHLAGDSFES